MIPYLGNKSNISDFLKQYIPINPSKWVEPFGGGFGLFFTLDLKEYPDTNFIYNDINPLNCILFEQLKNDDFISKVKSTNVTKELFENSYNNLIENSYSDVVEETVTVSKKNKKNSKSETTKKETKTVIKTSNSEDKALSWLIILCCGDSKDLMSKEYKGNSGFEILKYKLPRYSEYFKRIIISNRDYKDVLKQQDSEDTFFYVDPPYFGFEKYYVNNDFNEDSHSELSLELKKLKGKWLLSYYNFDNLEKWYSNYKIVSKKSNLSEEFLILGV
jgi:DNA adenine methylase